MTGHNIVIEKLAFGGNGVGRINGKVCFVPYSGPGDELTVRIVDEKKSYLNASIDEIISPSPIRVKPPCPIFGSCGGCNWQHITYDAQLEAKQKILAETLWRSARVPGDLVDQTVPAPMQYAYRSRVQFKVQIKAGKLDIGFFRQGTHQVENAPEGCLIALPDINEALQCLRKVLTSMPEVNQILQVNIDCAEQGCIAVIKYVGSDPDRIKASIIKQSGSLGPLTGVFLQDGKHSPLRKIWGNDLLAYSQPGITSEASSYLLKYRPGGFSQINRLQNQSMLGLIRDFAKFEGCEQVLDLYCGNGNFSLPLAGEVANITGIEESSDSIAAAIDNCRLNSVVNAKYIASDATSGVRGLIAKGQKFDVCILDPPRSGAAELLKEIPHLNPHKIIYISCDPNTLGRDCSNLSNMGYMVQKSIPVDMFPQTYHIESITLLQRE